jgi:isocitrate dehydrogenase
MLSRFQSIKKMSTIARHGARSMSRFTITDEKPTILYTLTDEAPALATYSFLRLANVYLQAGGINVEVPDISLSGRILAHFPERLTAAQRIPDDLADLGELTADPRCNIIKLPNISASIAQLRDAIAELQSQGYAIPNYPEVPTNDEEAAINATYSKVLGSAVNPVLRQGNSDRRAPTAVKNFAKKFPHSMGAWSADSETIVSSMRNGGDFFSNEQSYTAPEALNVRIEHVDASGNVTVMKDSVPLLEGEIMDSTFMSKKKLVEFIEEEVENTKKTGALFSVHLKATMMKVSDPIMFGHFVKVFYKAVFEKHADVLAELGVNANNGFSDLVGKIKQLPQAKQDEINADIEAVYAQNPPLAMVDSRRGITNLHVTSDVIIDASMPAMIRGGGKMWNTADQEQDANCIIPDNSYAGVYRATVDFHKKHGAFDVTTMGTCPNVGLMAQKAEEYGSHPLTFEIPQAGVMRVVTESGSVLMSHNVEEGDIWRACQVKDAPIQDWVKLAVNRSRLSGMPAVFWLNAERAHDAQVLQKVNRYLQDHDTNGLDISIMAPTEACTHTLHRMKAGQDTISVTGNVLRDYLTDLFPILELGTSAKMLSIVPLMQGGGVFETGAGGSAPKHVQQFEKEGHLRWDSLGEYFALAASLEHIGNQGHENGRILAEALDRANGTFLNMNKSPSRKVNQIDNRGSGVYLAQYWGQELLKTNPAFALQVKPFIDALVANEQKIQEELVACQGDALDLGGYFKPQLSKVVPAMRSSPTLDASFSTIQEPEDVFRF